MRRREDLTGYRAGAWGSVVNRPGAQRDGWTGRPGSPGPVHAETPEWGGPELWVPGIEALAFSWGEHWVLRIPQPGSRTHLELRDPGSPGSGAHRGAHRHPLPPVSRGLVCTLSRRQNLGRKDFQSGRKSQSSRSLGPRVRGWGTQGPLEHSRVHGIPWDFQALE